MFLVHFLGEDLACPVRGLGAQVIREGRLSMDAQGLVLHEKGLEHVFAPRIVWCSGRCGAHASLLDKQTNSRGSAPHPP